MATRSGIGTQAGIETPGWRVLSILLLAYIFNFLDRQILSILQIPIQRELALNDEQLGLMGGVAFALLYSGLGVPIAWLADRKDRVKIIAVSLAVWSAFTALCGAAQNFWQLFLARMGVGVGEAGGVAPAYALISDYFPPERRARAMAIFSLGIPIGTSLGVFFGGWLASSVDWRFAFALVGGLGLLLVPLMLLGIRDPGRGRFDRVDGKPVEPAPPFLTVMKCLARKPTFWLLSFGAACGSILGYGFAFWLPQFLTRTRGLELMDISWFYGSIALIGGVGGIWLGGVVGDRMGSIRPSGYPLIPAICFLIAAPLYTAAIYVPSLTLSWFMIVLATAFGLAWLGPVIAAVQLIVPPNMRASSSASFLLINNLIGIGFGIWFIGKLSTLLTPAYGQDALQHAMFYALGFYLLSALLYFLAAKRLPMDLPDRDPGEGAALRGRGTKRLIGGIALSVLLFVFVDKVGGFGLECYYVGGLSPETLCIKGSVYRGAWVVAAGLTAWGAYAAWKYRIIGRPRS